MRRLPWLIAAALAVLAGVGVGGDIAPPGSMRGAYAAVARVSDWTTLPALAGQWYQSSGTDADESGLGRPMIREGSTSIVAATGLPISGRYALESPGGATDRATVATASAAHSPGSGDFSVCAWVRWDSYTSPANLPDIAATRPTGAQGTVAGWVLGRNGFVTPSVAFAVDAASGVYRVRTYTWAPTAGTWHHTCGTYTASSGALALYADGSDVTGSSTLTQAGTIVGQSITSASPLTIGGRPGATNRPLNGGVSDLRLWAWALSASEVAAVYAGAR